MSKIHVPRFKKELGFHTTEQRSKLMSKIRSKETKPEIALRKGLWKKGIRYRINVKTVQGWPDLVINKYKIIVFVDGEFWHGFNWQEKKKKIKANRGFWIPKIERNIERDIQNNNNLTSMGYIVLRFWEHEIKKNLDLCIERILESVTVATKLQTKRNL